MNVLPQFHRILLVEDNPTALKLLSQLMEKAGYAYESAVDGQQAYERLQAVDPNYFSAIISDRMMPEMDGLTLLKKLKEDTSRQHIPFIMQTALADSASVQEGILAGAFYYLTKPLDIEVVEKVVESAVHDFQNHKELLEQLGFVSDSLLLMKSARFAYRTPQECKGLATLLSQLAQNPEKTVIGLYELMVNAVEHGNLGISYEEKTRLIESKSWSKEIDARLQEAENQAKKVTVEVQVEKSDFVVKISDMGEGFDYEQYLKVSPERLLDNHGRGIMMASSVGFSQMEYQDNGRTVFCRIKTLAA
ncbi:MAG: response regulator [Hydrogenovibrio sp.]|nr:response regulator [Hydrogenovibrio sp.]